MSCTRFPFRHVLETLLSDHRPLKPMSEISFFSEGDRMHSVSKMCEVSEVKPTNEVSEVKPTNEVSEIIVINRQDESGGQVLHLQVVNGEIISHRWENPPNDPLEDIMFVFLLTCLGPQELVVQSNGQLGRNKKEAIYRLLYHLRLPAKISFILPAIYHDKGEKSIFAMERLKTKTYGDVIKHLGIEEVEDHIKYYRYSKQKSVNLYWLRAKAELWRNYKNQLLDSGERLAVIL
jgi:hypothetical protein